MKNLTLILTLILMSIDVQAQTAYEKGMRSAFDLWDQDKLVEASNLFERIASVEKDNWLPPFYAGYTLVLNAFEIKDETQLKLTLDKAKTLLAKAEKLSPDNAEILIAQALHNTAYINFDGQKYGMTMSQKNTAIYQKASQLAPENPRVILAKAEWDMGSARFFNQSTDPYCKDVQRALEIFKSDEESEKAFYPDWGMKRAEQILEECGK
jgi:tetratricopeptide (TPR) repeat protein